MAPGTFRGCKKLLAGLRSRRKTTDTKKESEDTNRAHGEGPEFSITEEIFRATAGRSVATFQPSTFSPYYLYATVVHSTLEDDVFHLSRGAANTHYNVDSTEDAQHKVKASLSSVSDLLSTETPFIVLNTELIGAFARAKSLTSLASSYQVTVAIVDTRFMPERSLLSCNALREAIGMEGIDKCSTMMLAWSHISTESVVCSIPWLDIVESDIGKVWFPMLALPQPPEVKMDWEEMWEEYSHSFTARSQNEDRDIESMFRYLEWTFGVRAEEEVTRLLVETFTAWNLGCIKLQACDKHALLGRSGVDIDDYVEIAASARALSNLASNPPQSDLESDEDNTATVESRYRLQTQGSHEDVDRMSLKSLDGAVPSIKVSPRAAKRTRSLTRSTELPRDFGSVIRHQRSSMRLSSYLSNNALSAIAKKEHDKQTRIKKVHERASTLAISRGHESYLDEAEDGVLDSLSKPWTESAKRSDSATVDASPAQLYLCSHCGHECDPTSIIIDDS